ncbi:MAG: hypothetical protein LC808_09875 [Actinobacteria bacterium]|nr:hypothetical protein [Actinomycetota bacterium]
MGCLGFTIVGGVLEVIGLVFVAIEIGRIQRREFGAPRMLMRLRGWLRRRRGKQAVHHIRSTTDTARATDAASVSVHRAEATTLEGRLARLETQHDDLEREFNVSKDRLSKEIGDVRREAADVRANLDRELAAREESQRSFLRGTVTFQSIGTVFFLVGVVFSVLGNAVSC